MTYCIISYHIISYHIISYVYTNIWHIDYHRIMQISKHVSRHTDWSNAGCDWGDSSTGSGETWVLTSKKDVFSWRFPFVCNYIISMTSQQWLPSSCGFLWKDSGIVATCQHISTSDPDDPKFGVSKATQPASPREVSPWTSCGPNTPLPDFG